MRKNDSEEDLTLYFASTHALAMGEFSNKLTTNFITSKCALAKQTMFDFHLGINLVRVFAVYLKNKQTPSATCKE